MWAFVGCVLALFAFYNISNHCTQRFVSQQGAHPEKYIQEMYTLYNVQDEIYETQYELCVYKQFAHYSKGILQYVYSTYRMQQIVCLYPSYLIFVIFFTLAKFLENKIYTEKTRKLRQNTQ